MIYITQERREGIDKVIDEADAALAALQMESDLAYALARFVRHIEGRIGSFATRGLLDAVETDFRDEADARIHRGKTACGEMYAPVDGAAKEEPPVTVFPVDPIDELHDNEQGATVIVFPLGLHDNEQGDGASASR